MFRRYPALVYLVGAGLLGLLLPSALRIPQSGPSTLAEYAPVTGEGEGESDISELGAGSSGGVGFGRAGGRTDPSDITDSDRGLVRKAGDKRCVGKPARQTEDPLSPPCIAVYEGDNGGATAKGVTRDEVKVIIETEETTVDQQAGAFIDCAEAPRSDEPPRDLVCKAWQKYFNDRFQTYGPHSPPLVGTHTQSR